jgi:hypothetical protein
MLCQWQCMDMLRVSHLAATLDGCQLVQLLLKELDGMYQGQALQYCLQSHVQNGSQEPYIEGAYSYNWDEYQDQKEVLQKPIDGSLLLWRILG